MSSSRKNVEDIYPLAPLQQGMLFHARYQPELGTYAEALPFLLEGRLDADALERAYRALVERHAVLRTAFVWEGVPQPLQVVHRRVEPEFTRLDWRGLSEPEWRARLGELLAADRRRGYDLGKAPLLRATLVRLAEDRHLLVWASHHILLDGWSLPLLLEELDALYRAEAAGRPAHLPPAPRYRDYIAWLLKQDASKLAGFWRAYLAGFGEPTPLPLDRGGAGEPREQALETLEIGAAETARLQTFAREAGVTLNTLAQAAWALVLARYSGRDDVVFGATLAGRPAELPGVERMVGLFINTLPMRVRLPARATVGEWLAEIQRAAAELRQHEHAPLVDVQGWSEVPRDRPLFESLLVFENYPLGPAEADGDGGGLPLEGLPVPERTNYPLTLVFAPGETLRLRVTYDAERFPAGAARRVLAATAAALDALAAGAERRVGDLAPLTEEDRRALAAWNRDAERAWPAGLVHRLFEAQAARTPDAAAIVFGNERITYRELNERANRLAHRLRALGAGAESPVGVCMERTPELVAALLGVLKAGGAYVPLDPAYPAERLAFMLRDSGARALVTGSGLADRLPAEDLSVVLAAAMDDPDLPVHDPEPVGTPECLAWILYTSGSTGRPKGVAIRHASAAAFLHWMRERFPLEPEARVLGSTSVSFDVHVAEIHFALAWGHTLALVENALSLAGLGEAAGIIHAGMVPTAAAELLRRDAIPSTLRTLVLAGEPVPPALARELYQRTAVELVGNAYGPTEDTTFSTFAALPRDGRVTIGSPLPGSRGYVLDAGLRPVPAGAPGELYLAGAGLSRGYVARPALTAERYLPDPFAAEPGARMYRTGDLARLMPGGEAEYLGRTDFQVKIRGFRVETGEVEDALAAHPRVQRAAVVAREDPAGGLRLVAYFVPRDGEAASAAELREHLEARLPEYMVPAAIVPLYAFPLTPSGKVDRRALPTPDLAPEDEAWTAPATPTEVELAALWRELLRVERVGAGDSFFLLGGHSLLATRLVSAVLDRFGVELPLRTVFDAPRLGELAARIDAIRDRELAALLEDVSEDELRALLEAEAAAE